MKRLYTAAEIFALSIFITLYGWLPTIFMGVIFMILIADYIFNYME